MYETADTCGTFSPRLSLRSHVRSSVARAVPGADRYVRIARLRIIDLDATGSGPMSCVRAGSTWPNRTTGPRLNVEHRPGPPANGTSWRPPPRPTGSPARPRTLTHRANPPAPHPRARRNGWDGKTHLGQPESTLWTHAFLVRRKWVDMSESDSATDSAP